MAIQPLISTDQRPKGHFPGFVLRYINPKGLLRLAAEVGRNMGNLSLLFFQILLTNIHEDPRKGGDLVFRMERDRNLN